MISTHVLLSLIARKAIEISSRFKQIPTDFVEYASFVCPAAVSAEFATKILQKPEGPDGGFCYKSTFDRRRIEAPKKFPHRSRGKTEAREVQNPLVSEPTENAFETTGNYRWAICSEGGATRC